MKAKRTNNNIVENISSLEHCLALVGRRLMTPREQMCAEYPILIRLAMKYLAGAVHWESEGPGTKITVTILRGDRGKIYYT